MRPITHGRGKRLIYAGAGAVALAIPATAAALTAGPLSSPGHVTRPVSPSASHVVTVKHRTHRTAAQRGCRKLFTVRMGEGAANLVYSGTRKVTLHDFKVLGNIERCQRNPAAQGFVRSYDRHHRRKHRDRVASARSAQEQASSQATASSVTTPAGGGPLPTCTWQPESGGDPSAVNPTTGAGGYYQIMPSTWQAYGGTGAPQDAPLAEQTAIAQKIWAEQGPSAWVNC